MQWTGEQKLVIEGLRNKNLLVSAAAGAGKTTVLVERIIHLLLEEEVNIDQMLIVTFTRAAAAEMKEKIQQVLEERLAELEKAPHIREQLDRLNRAQISTNHAFALEIVKRHIHLLDIDPAFRVGESTETEILQDEALEEVMEDYYRQGADSFHKLIESYSKGRGDDKLRQIILDVYHFIQSKPYPLQWLDEAVKMFSPIENNYEQTPWMVELRDKIRAILSDGEEQLTGALDICNRKKG
ncbi:MAG: UvrD-helicase domain-containing protein, partial [Halanaerobiales bacterium]